MQLIIHPPIPYAAMQSHLPTTLQQSQIDTHTHTHNHTYRELVLYAVLLTTSRLLHLHLCYTVTSTCLAWLTYTGYDSSKCLRVYDCRPAIYHEATVSSIHQRLEEVESFLYTSTVQVPQTRMHTLHASTKQGIPNYSTSPLQTRLQYHV